MSFDQGNNLDFSLPAAADLSAKQYRFITIDASGNAAVSTLGALSAGVLQDAPAAATRAARVRPNGISKVVLGGSVTAGNPLISDANGAAVTTATSGVDFMGIALASGTSGNLIAMLIQPRGSA
jgi:hypothetical protein